MFLRTTLERFTPANGKNIERLSPQARKYAFGVAYMKATSRCDKIVEYRQDEVAKADDGRPLYRMIVVRNQASIGQEKSLTTSVVNRSSPYPLDAIVAELNSASKIARVNDIESTAAFAKPVGYVVLAGCLGLGAAALVFPPESSPQNTLPGCESMMGQGSSLVPAESQTVQAAQQAGEVVCELGNYNYVVENPKQPSDDFFCDMKYVGCVN